MSRSDIVEFVLRWLLDPAVMAYIAAGVASIAVWFRSRLEGKKAVLFDSTVFAFGHVEKLWEMLPEKAKDKTTKVKEFIGVFTEAYAERTGKAPSAQVISHAVQNAAKLALAKKMPSFFDLAQ